MDDNSETGRQMTASDQQFGQVSTHFASSNSAPATSEQFMVSVTPCLALVGGVGMKGDDRTEWLLAAHSALDGIPADLLKEGVRAAMRSADHPSKIVPAIMAEIGQRWDDRKRRASTPRYQPALPKPIETAEEKAEREEVAALMGKLARKLSANQ